MFQTIDIKAYRGLKNITLQNLSRVNILVGEIVDAGKTLGEISEATKYYSLEGDNLNFCVKKDGGSIDPQTLMKD